MVYQKKNSGYFKSEKEIPSQNSLPVTNKFDWVSCGGTPVPKSEPDYNHERTKCLD